MSCLTPRESLQKIGQNDVTLIAHNPLDHHRCWEVHMHGHRYLWGFCTAPAVILHHIGLEIAMSIFSVYLKGNWECSNLVQLVHHITWGHVPFIAYYEFSDISFTLSTLTCFANESASLDFNFTRIKSTLARQKMIHTNRLNTWFLALTESFYELDFNSVLFLFVFINFIYSFF